MRKSIGDWSWLPDLMPISELARLLGVPRQTTHNWAKGRNDPNYQNIRKLAKLIGSWAELERLTKAKFDFSASYKLRSNSSRSIFTASNYFDLTKVANQLRSTGEFEKLRAQAHIALKEVAGKDSLSTARLWFEIGYAELMLGYPLDAVELTRKARKLLPPKEDSIFLADTYWLSGECLRVMGKLNQAYSYLHEAQEIYKRLKARPSFHEQGPLWLEWDLGRYFAAYGEYHTALKYFERMEKMAKNTWLAEAKVIAVWSRGDIAEMNSDFVKAFASYSNAKELAWITGNSFWEAMSLWRTAEVQRKLSQFEEALATAEDARCSFQSFGNKRMMAKTDCVLAACYLQTKDLNKAIDLYNNSQSFFSNSEDIPMKRTGLLGRALVDLVVESRKPTPDYRKPLEAFREIDTDYPNADDPYLAVYNDLAYAEAQRLAGSIETALASFNNVMKTSNKCGLQLEKAHSLLGIAATKLLDGEADRQSCIEALRLYQKVGSSWGQVQTLITLALIEHEMGEVNTQLLHKAAILARDNSLSDESQFIETLKINASAQKEHHVLLFVQAV